MPDSHPATLKAQFLLAPPRPNVLTGILLCFMLRRIFLIIGIAIVSLFTGCAQNNDLSSAPKESSIPWNRPESWEGAGALGGLGMGSR